VRRDKPFVCLSISALSESLLESELFGHEKGAYSGAGSTKLGKFEIADGGTVYIPEISSLPENIQLKLLHFFQYKTISKVGQDPRKRERRLDVRLLLATNEDLQRLVDAGRLRRDFYHRIVGVTLSVPPLRKRIDDIPYLAAYFVKKFTGHDDVVITAEAIDFLKSQLWPGNVREFENCVKHAVVFAKNPLLTIVDFDESKKPQNFAFDEAASPDEELLPYRLAEEEFRKRYFSSLLSITHNDIMASAKIAGLSSQGLRKALKQLALITPSPSLRPDGEE
jgi:transcriptional regulator with GAF, ATPase, and Fis domain